MAWCVDMNVLTTCHLLCLGGLRLSSSTLSLVNLTPACAYTCACM